MDLSFMIKERILMYLDLEMEGAEFLHLMEIFTEEEQKLDLSLITRDNITKSLQMDINIM